MATGTRSQIRVLLRYLYGTLRSGAYNEKQILNEIKTSMKSCMENKRDEIDAAQMHLTNCKMSIQKCPFYNPVSSIQRI